MRSGILSAARSVPLVSFNLPILALGGADISALGRVGHTSVSVVLDQYGHLLPGSEERTTEALDVMASDAAQAQASVSPLRRSSSARVQRVANAPFREPVERAFGGENRP
ncbi:MAG: hypothetical protein GEU68_11195 [Actinobacteria bacterium]|nr:hypothetical protein [Actinomycetota bacterium]